MAVYSGQVALYDDRLEITSPGMLLGGLTIERLLALEGAIRGVKKTELPQERKAELKEFYRIHKM